MRWNHSLQLLGLALFVTATAPVLSETPRTAEIVEEQDNVLFNELLNGPLSRVREGGTPPVPEDQRLTPYSIQLPQYTDVPGACQVDSPPEYSPTEGVMLRYSSGSWPQVVTDIVAALTGDPTDDEIAYVVVSPGSQQAIATSQFTAAGADMSKVVFINESTNSIWLRDYGPHFIWEGGARGIVDSHYYPNRPLDNFLPTLIADDAFNEPSYDIGLYYSGGNFQPGPNRSGFTTNLVNTDNPSFNNDFIGELYDEYQGIDTLHILPRLPASVDGTGHIDMWFYLVDEHTVIISEFIPGSNATAIQVTDAAVIYMESLGFEVFRPSARNIGSVHYTYANAFRVNDRIFIPTYGEGNSSFLDDDAAAQAIWEQAAGPGVEIIGINSWDIIPASGAIHCIMMQVPRYDDATPSSCVTAPEGGEALVAGSDYTIRWAASDDVGVDAIDLYYAVDGGADVPIALDQPGGRDSYRWSVPLLESDTGQVKVVARDEDANSDASTSALDFEIATAVSRVYDFSSGAGVDKFAFGNQTNTWGQISGIRRPSTVNSELSATNYARLAASDATGGDGDQDRYISPTPSGSSESTHVLEFTIDEDPSTIVDLALNVEGYSDSCAQIELYVWDYMVGRWSDGRGGFLQNRFVDNFAGNEDENLSANIRSSFERYIDPSGQLTLLLYVERGGNESFLDYASVTVTYEPCPGSDVDFDGWADACDNCIDVGNLDQSNSDADDRGDACDCAPSDSGAFDFPFEISGLSLEDATTLTWNSDAPNSGSGTTYDVLRGDASNLSSGFDGGTCFASDLSDVTVEDTTDPAVGSSYYYLIRSNNVCGPGSYGTDSFDVERQSGVCP